MPETSYNNIHVIILKNEVEMSLYVNGIIKLVEPRKF